MDYLQMMKDRWLVRGDWDASKVSNLTPQYFWGRQTYLDFRGDLRVHPMITLGPNVKLLTASHDFSQGTLGPTVFKRVWIDEGAFVGGFSLLYNCHIKHHAIVACGAVVRNMTVEPHTIVEGNPAHVTRRFVDGKWIGVERDDDETS